MTWKFAFGLVAGAAAVIVTHYFFGLPSYSSLSSAFELEVNEFRSAKQIITNDELLESPYKSIYVHFSAVVEPQQRDFIYVKITPNYPIDVLWIIDTFTGLEEPTNELVIKPKKIYPGEQNPRYQTDMTYQVEVGGPILEQSKTIKFRTPSSE